MCKLTEKELSHVLNMAQEKLAFEPSLLGYNAMREDYGRPIIYKSILENTIVRNTVKEFFRHFEDGKADSYSVDLIVALHCIKHYEPITKKDLKSRKNQASKFRSEEQRKYEKAIAMLKGAAVLIGLDQDFYTKLPLGEYCGRSFGIKELAADRKTNNPQNTNPFWGNPIEEYLGTRGKAASNNIGAKNGAAIKYLDVILPDAIQGRNALISELLGSCDLSIKRQTVATCLRPARK